MDKILEFIIVAMLIVVIAVGSITIYQFIKPYPEVKLTPEQLEQIHKSADEIQRNLERKHLIVF